MNRGNPDSLLSSGSGHSDTVPSNFDNVFELISRIYRNREIQNLIAIERDPAGSFQWDCTGWSLMKLMDDFQTIARANLHAKR